VLLRQICCLGTDWDNSSRGCSKTQKLKLFNLTFKIHVYSNRQPQKRDDAIVTDYQSVLAFE